MAVSRQRPNAGEDGFLHFGIRTPRSRAPARRKSRQTGSVHTNSLRVQQQAEQGRQNAAGLRCLRAREIVEAPSYSRKDILLSIRQTCKYSGLDFFDFIRSGEKDIHTFEESLRSRRRPDGIQKHLRPEGSGEKAAFIT